MSLQEIVVAGTLKPDGTLELDQKPNLAPGRVTVVLRQESEAAPQEDWWQYHAAHSGRARSGGLSVS